MKKQVPRHKDLSFEQAQIAKYLKKLHFKPRLFGVDQADVWKKIEELNGLYETALLAERARYDRMLEEFCSTEPGQDESAWDGGEGAVYDESGDN